MKTLKIICRVLAVILIASSVGCFGILLFGMQGVDTLTKTFSFFWFLLTGAAGALLYYKTYEMNTTDFDPTKKPVGLKAQLIYVREVVLRASYGGVVSDSGDNNYIVTIGNKTESVTGFCRIVEMMYYRNLIGIDDRNTLANVLEINKPLMYAKIYSPWYFPLHESVWKKVRLAYIQALIDAELTLTSRYAPPSFPELLNPVHKIMKEYHEDTIKQVPVKTD